MNIILNSNSIKNSLEGEREVYEMFINEIKSNLRKEKYKKVLEDIEVGERNYSEILNKWQILDIKITTLFKIFYKFLYHNDLSIIKDYSNLDSFLNKVDKYIEDISETIYKNESNLEEIEIKFQFETVITAYITALYTYSLIAKKERRCGDCCAYLGIAEKLVKYFIEKTKNNKFLYTATQIYLFISSLLISDEDYNTSQNYQKQVLCIAFRIISYLNGNSEYIDKSKLKKSKWIYIEKAIVSICVAFYHKGFCHESLGNLFKATESYSQAAWFSNKFLLESYPDFAQFLSEVDFRVARDAKIWLKSQNQSKNKSISKTSIKESDNKKLNEMDYLKIQYKDTIKKIEQLSFPEFDEERRCDHNLHEILYSLKMNNYLMSDDFKNLVADLENLNIHKIDKDTKDKINKKIVQIRARESYERFCSALIDNNDPSKSKKKRLSSDVNNMNIEQEVKSNNNNTTLETIPSVTFFSKDKPSRTTLKLNNLQLFNKNLNKKEKSSSTTRLHTTKDKLMSTENINEELYQNSISYRKGITQTENSVYTPRDFDLILPDDALDYIQTEPKTSRLKSFVIEKSSQMTPNLINTKQTSSIINTNKEELKRYNYNKFIFNSNYQRKLKVLSTNFNKELDFQKRLLRLKKNEKIIVEEINFKKKSDEYNFRFTKKIKDDKQVFLRKKEIKHKFDHIVGKDNNGKEKIKLEHILLRSLDTKKLSELRRLRKQKNVEKVVMREDSQFKPLKFEKVETENLIKEAKAKIQVLEMEINFINKISDENMKEIHPIIYKEKPYISRKPIVKKSKREYNKNFTKIMKGISLSTSLLSNSNSPSKNKFMTENDMK